MDTVRSRCSARSSGVGSVPTIFGRDLGPFVAQRDARKARPLERKRRRTGDETRPRILVVEHEEARCPSQLAGPGSAGRALALPGLGRRGSEPRGAEAETLAANAGFGACTLLPLQRETRLVRSRPGFAHGTIRVFTRHCCVHDPATRRRDGRARVVSVPCSACGGCSGSTRTPVSDDSRTQAGAGGRGRLIVAARVTDPRVVAWT